MKQTVFATVALSVALAVCAQSARAGDGPPLSAPSDTAAREYLGIPAGDSFRLEDIAADVLIVELFSFFCSTCRAEASVLNRLFWLIQQSPRSGRCVRMLGIGIGSDASEVRQFREQFSVPFPLVSDRRATMMNYLSVQGTPTVVLLKRQPGGDLKEVFRKTGVVGDPAALFDQVRGYVAVPDAEKTGKREAYP